MEQYTVQYGSVQYGAVMSGMVWQGAVPDGGLCDLVVDDHVRLVVFGEGRPGSRNFTVTNTGITGQDEREGSHQFKRSRTRSDQFRPVKTSTDSSRPGPGSETDL